MWRRIAHPLNFTAYLLVFENVYGVQKGGNPIYRMQDERAVEEKEGAHDASMQVGKGKRTRKERKARM